MQRSRAQDDLASARAEITRAIVKGLPARDLIDAYIEAVVKAEREQLRGAVEALQAVAATGRWIDAKMVAVEALRALGEPIARPTAHRGRSA